MRDPNSIISDVSAWSRVAELATRSTEHTLLTLAAAQPIPTLPLDDAEQRSDILLVEHSLWLNSYSGRIGRAKGRAKPLA